jgi:CheY-like chemotaxis protein
MNTAAPTPGQASILIIENELSDRLLMERVLTTRGYRCLSAANGREALALLERARVDLILTDLSMPVLDGYRTTRLIRDRPGLETVPIVAVTAYAPEDLSTTGADASYTAYLMKPFKPRQLLELVERLLMSRTDRS